MVQFQFTIGMLVVFVGAGIVVESGQSPPNHRPVYGMNSHHQHSYGGMDSHRQGGYGGMDSHRQGGYGGMDSHRQSGYDGMDPHHQGSYGGMEPQHQGSYGGSDRHHQGGYGGFGDDHHSGYGGESHHPPMGGEGGEMFSGNGGYYEWAPPKRPDVGAYGPGLGRYGGKPPPRKGKTGKPRRKTDKQVVNKQPETGKDVLVSSPSGSSSSSNSGHTKPLSEQGSVWLWNDCTLIYQINSSLPNDTKTAIADAMEVISSQTIIKFQERSVEKDYVFFMDGGVKNCTSELGRYGGKQTTSLGEGCGYEGIVIHEIMHVLGFNHEQARADRDDYVTIIEENIKSGLSANFKSFSADLALTGGQEYDYNSIMHYRQDAFAKEDGLFTIAIPDDVDNTEVGQRDAMTDYDIAKINAVYQKICPVDEA